MESLRALFKSGVILPFSQRYMSDVVLWPKIFASCFCDICCLLRITHRLFLGIYSGFDLLLFSRFIPVLNSLQDDYYDYKSSIGTVYETKVWSKTGKNARSEKGIYGYMFSTFALNPLLISPFIIIRKYMW